MSRTTILSIVITALVVILLCVGFTFLFLRYRKEALQEVASEQNDIAYIDAALEERSSKGRKKKKVSHIVEKVLFWVFLAIFIPLTAYALVARISGHVPVIGNETALVVASGSMSQKNQENTYLYDETIAEPQRDYQFQTYDIIFLKKPSSSDEVQRYDVVAYQNRELNVTVIHRIIAIREDGTYLMRGDANNASDEYHPSYSDVVGVYHGKRVRYVGAFLLFLQSPQGIITILGILYLLGFIDAQNQKIDEAAEKRKERLMHALDTAKNGSNTSSLTITYQDSAYFFEQGEFVKKESQDSIPESTPTLPLLLSEEKEEIDHKGDSKNGKE